MQINKYNPFEDIQSLWAPFGYRNQANSLPTTRVEEREDDYLISIDLPGIRSSDLDVAVRDDTLTVRAERRSRKQEQEGSEATLGKYERRFRLPADARVEDISANLDHGVLELTVPRRKPEERKVEIKVA